MKATASNLTAAKFETLCGGSIRASQVTQEMLDMANKVMKTEAKRLLAMPSSDWWQSPTIGEIEDAIPCCRDRHVQAVLTVAVVWGEDDFGGRA